MHVVLAPFPPLDEDLDSMGRQALPQEALQDNLACMYVIKVKFALDEPVNHRQTGNRLCSCRLVGLRIWNDTLVRRRLPQYIAKALLQLHKQQRHGCVLNDEASSSLLHRSGTRTACTYAFVHNLLCIDILCVIMWCLGLP
jgi:hypothetical protein